MTREKEPNNKESVRMHFSCKPRCCEWCNKRGWKDRPLTRLYTDTSDMGPFYWWVHEGCAKVIVEDEHVLAFWNFGPYPKLETT